MPVLFMPVIYRHVSYAQNAVNNLVVCSVIWLLESYTQVNQILTVICIVVVNLKKR